MIVNRCVVMRLRHFEFPSSIGNAMKRLFSTMLLLGCVDHAHADEPKKADEQAAAQADAVAALDNCSNNQASRRSLIGLHRPARITVLH